jgi:hypothetical protein
MSAHQEPITPTTCGLLPTGCCAYRPRNGVERVAVVLCGHELGSPRPPALSRREHLERKFPQLALRVAYEVLIPR